MGEKGSWGTPMIPFNPFDDMICPRGPTTTRDIHYLFEWVKRVISDARESKVIVNYGIFGGILEVLVHLYFIYWLEG